MIQANINDRYAQLSQQEKAELIGIYTRAGYRDLASIIAHYNSCGGKLYADGGPEKTYQDYLNEYNAARSARASAMRDEDNAVKALREYQMNYNNPRGYWYWTDEGKRLDAAVDAARGKLKEARKNFDAAEKVIGEKTLEKYAGPAYDPMYFWDYVADTKEKADKYYKDRAIRESAGAKEVADYFNSYANSPGYQRIRENQRQWWINRHPYRRIWQMGTGTAMESTDWLQDKFAGLSPEGVFDISTYPELSVMRSGNGHGAITVGTFDSKEFPYWFTLPHEMAHISNTGGYATSTLSAQKEALDQNTNTEPGHDSRPSEKHSDKEALMFMLYKEGIYDSRGEKDCTPEDIAKLRKKYPDLRPLQQMDDEKAAWMINHVADAGNQKSLYGNHLGNVSAEGGRLFEMGGPSGPINPNFLRQAVKQTLLRAIPKNILVGAADLADSAAGIPSLEQIKEIPEAGKFYIDALDNGESEYYEDGYIENPGLTFLLDRGRQSEMLKKMGYHPVNDGYYGSVTSATRKLNALKGDAIPIFQRGDDEVDFSEVEPIADKDGNYFFERTSYLGDIFGENELNHASYHPVSFYRHKRTGDIYVRGYDLNDYGKHDKNMWKNLPEAIGNSLFNQGYSYDKTGQTYGDEQYLAEIYDYIGNPFVQRTALVKAPEKLVRKYFGEEYSSGGKIHIKPENRGKFTALKKRTGQSASWFKAHGTPAQKKMAVFALNSRKWKHEDGGPLREFDNISSLF